MKAASRKTGPRSPGGRRSGAAGKPATRTGQVWAICGLLVLLVGLVRYSASPSASKFDRL